MLSELQGLQILHVCYKSFPIDALLNALRPLQQLKELHVYIRNTCFIKDKLRKLLPNTICKINSCTY
jgi:hypothetical protein